MTRTPVSSSNVHSVGYEHGVLEVEFKNHTVYRFRGVPAATHEEFMKAPSKGSYFSKNIKNNFPTDKL